MHFDTYFNYFWKKCSSILSTKLSITFQNRCTVQFVSLFPLSGWYHVGIKLFICSDKKGGEGGGGAFITSHIKSVLTHSHPDLFFALKENVHYLAVAVIANDFSVLAYGCWWATECVTSVSFPLHFHFHPFGSQALEDLTLATFPNLNKVFLITRPWPCSCCFFSVKYRTERSCLWTAWWQFQ